MKTTRCTITLSLALLAAGQFNPPNLGGIPCGNVWNGQNGSLLCNSSMSAANATGYHIIAPDIARSYGGGQEAAVDPAVWLQTVTETSNLTQTSLWFGTEGVDYWDTSFIDFDACAYIFIATFTTNTIRLGQDDPGDCSVMLSPSCRSALTSKIQAAAYQFTQVGPSSNLTSGIIPHACDDILERAFARDIDPFGQIQAACSQDFATSNGSYLSIQNYHLTSNNSTNSSTARICSAMQQDCPLHPSGMLTGYGAFYHVFNLPGNLAYDVATRSTTPILTVFFDTPDSPADVLGYPQSSAQLTCLRVTDFAKGSRVSPRLPSGTPYTNSTSSSSSSSKGPTGHSSLSGGAIAGIVIGAVAIAAIAAAVVFAWWRFVKKRQVHSVQTHDWKRAEDMEHEHDENAQIYELGAADSKAEIDGTQVLEADGAQRAAELDDRTRWSFDSSQRSVLSHDTTRS